MIKRIELNVPQNVEQIFKNNLCITEQDKFLLYAHEHTVAETKKWLQSKGLTKNIMYYKGRPDRCDAYNGQQAGVKCTDGWIWN